MTTVFDLGAMLGTDTDNQVKMISCNDLTAYHNHKFSLYTGERLDDMVESIKANGIFTPLIVQPLDNGKYEILIGHNRHNAAQIAGLPAVPCIVKAGLTEEEAEIYVVESNIIQRGFDNLRISERAEALKMEQGKLFSQGKRNDILRELEMLEGATSSPMGNKSSKGETTNHKLADQYGIGSTSVARYLRVTYCCDSIKRLVDDEQIALRAAVEVSYLSDDEQELVAKLIEDNPKLLNMKAAEQLKKLKQSGELTEETISETLTPADKEKAKTKSVKIPTDTFNRYFSDGKTAEEIQDTVIKALEHYFKYTED